MLILFKFISNFYKFKIYNPMEYRILIRNVCNRKENINLNIFSTKSICSSTIGISRSKAIFEMGSYGRTVSAFLRYRASILNFTGQTYFNQKNVRLKRNFGCAIIHSSSAPTDSSLKEKRMFKKKSPRISTNIIHVGEEIVSDKDTKVKRLKPSQLHKVESPYAFKNVKTIGIEAESLVDSTVNSEVLEISDESHNNLEEIIEDKNIDIRDLDSKSIYTSFDDCPKKKKSKPENEKENSLKLYEKLRAKGRNNNFNSMLTSYISVCVYIGHSDSAFQTFKYYLRREKRMGAKYMKTLTLQPYNEILKAVAIEGNYKKMKEIRSHLQGSKLTPDHNTFAYILTCLGHFLDSPDVKIDIESTLQWMEKCEVKLEDVLKCSQFPETSFRNCLEAVKIVNQNMGDTLKFLNSDTENLMKENCYDNILVNEMNESLFSKTIMSPAEGVITGEELSELVKCQVAQELKGYINIPSIIKEDPADLVTKNRELLDQWEKHWRESLRESVSKRQKFMSENFRTRDFKGLDFYPYFAVLEVEDIVNLLMLEVNKLCLGSDYYSPSLSFLAMELGNLFHNRFLIKYKENTGILSSLLDVYTDYCAWYLGNSTEGSSYVPRVQWNKIVSENLDHTRLRDYPPEWSYTVKASIGKLLYSIIFSSVSVWNKSPKNSSPAFYKVHRKYDLRTRDELKPSPILVKVFQETSHRNLVFQSGSLPMLSPPVPWTSPRFGGYFVSKSELVRVVQHAHQQKNRMQEVGPKQMFPVLDSLNQLGSIPWKINSPLLDILIEIFNKKGWEKMEVSPPPSSLPQPPPVFENMSPAEKRDLKKVHVEYQKKKREMYSLWCSTLYKLSIANHYRDRVIWLPQNLDFRGRTYPIPPHLTHLTSDVFRAVMMFAQGKKLGKEGLFWLKLHIVNLTGMKKRDSIQDRIDFCDEIMDEIFDSADNPLSGRQWWTESDEPWQTLAACKELVAALRSESPEDFVSHLPIHQDGSCNGLQHYAALGRDKAGAMSVNLVPSIKPMDVYSDVVNLVEIGRQKDAHDGVEIAKVLEGVVKRKVIKQTIMTTVYGVTRYGAKLQILRQLNYLDDFPENQRFAASSYLTSKTFQSLGTIFGATREIQDWLVKIAEGVSKCCLKNVEWVTPLGFPVVQPYSKDINIKVIPGKIFTSFNCDNFLKPNLTKQKNAFPPNFIHSLDSSHMMLTSLFSQRAGITFVSIHDCFWTHASTVPIMNKICREQFVKLHSQPILEDLAHFMVEKYSIHESTPFTILKGTQNTLASLETILENIPKKGDFDINEVRDSVFFFS